ncbi:MAG: acyl-CoA dehydrogenase family protein [Myxococcota bacterium]|nr:acyl-CoA dehydrogenase family protein [Myxococcota bacterium]
MKRTPIGHVLQILNRFSTSPVIDKWGIRHRAEELIYQGVKTGVQVGVVAQSKFKPIKELLPEDRLRVASKPPKRFDLSLTEEQRMLREMLVRFSANVLRPEARKADKAWDISDEVLAQSQELGLNLLAIPEALDGAATARSPLTSCLIAEELAKGDFSLAMALLAPLSFVNALSEFGSSAQQARFLPAFVGEAMAVATMAFMEPTLRFAPTRFKTTATKVADGYRLCGVKTMVPLGKRAEVFLVLAHLKGVGPRGFIVESHAKGFKVEHQRSMGLGGAGLAEIHLDRVLVPRNALLGEKEIQYNHARLVDLGRLALCSLMVGACEAAVDYVIDYGNQRIAFGEPITHRQGVAFTIADMATETEAMRLMVLRAASRAEQGLAFQKEAFLAHTFCAEHAMIIGSNSVQLLGGHGFVCEHPTELWYRQLRAGAVLVGNLMA